MKNILLILTIFFGSLIPTISQTPDVITYQDWKIVYNKNCENQYNECIDFYYAITRTRTKVYNYNDGHYYYYYYLIVQSNSTYQNGGWAYTRLTNVNFYLNNTKVHFEPYLLFREKNNICIFWHPTDRTAKIHFEWQNISIY